MSTFLTGAVKLRQNCEIPGTGPTAVAGQTGLLKRVVDWYADAWRDIQNRNNNPWRWMRRPFTLNTVAGDNSYAYTDATDVDATGAISRFAYWWAHDLDDPIRCYLQSGGVSGEYRLVWLPWEQWKYLYGFGSQTNQRPIHVSVDHQNNLRIGPKPDAVYVVSGDFQRSAQELTADGDTPEMPVRFHDLIVYRAMEKYGANSIAAEVFARAQLEGGRLMKALEADQLPRVTFGGPLT